MITKLNRAVFFGTPLGSVLVGSLCVLAAASGLGNTRSAKSVEFQVEGVVAWQGRDGKFLDGGGRTSRFLVAVKDHQWYIRLVPTNWPQRVALDRKIPNPLVYEASCEGTNIFALTSCDPNDFPAPLDSRFALRWPAPPSGDSFSLREAYALWYAYASHLYCATVTNGVLLAPQPALGNVVGSLETHSSFPHLPTRIAATNSTGMPDFIFSALAFTNFLDLALPLQVELAYFHHKESVPWCTVRIVADSFAPNRTRSSFVLELQKPTLVHDFTYAKSNPLYTAIKQTNGWLSADEVRSMYEAWRASAPKPHDD